MSKPSLRRPVFSLLLATAALVACSDSAPFAPDATDARLAGAAMAGATTTQLPDLGPCPDLAVEGPSSLALRLYARGVQIYHWNGTSWSFSGPEAVLSADAGGRSVVGTHYAGPTWESASGAKVVATVEDRCTPDPAAIAWLRLRAVATTGPGIFDSVSYIQRINTAGGIAPAQPGSTVGQEARVPYTTEYVFYRAQ